MVNTKKVLKIVAIVVGVIVVVMFLGILGSSQDDQSQPTQRDDFGELSRQRLDEIAASIEELDSITCQSKDCDSVVYFNFNALPEDYEMIIRSNAATFSNFKLKEKGASHVTVVGQFNGSTILSCDASKGVVDECR